MALKGLEMAYPRGIEPLTFWSVARRSIQLSYGRVIHVNVARTGLEPVLPT